MECGFTVPVLFCVHTTIVGMAETTYANIVKLSNENKFCPKKRALKQNAMLSQPRN